MYIIIIERMVTVIVVTDMLVVTAIIIIAQFILNLESPQSKRSTEFIQEGRDLFV